MLRRVRCRGTGSCRAHRCHIVRRSASVMRFWLRRTYRAGAPRLRARRVVRFGMRFRRRADVGLFGGLRSRRAEVLPAAACRPQDEPEFAEARRLLRVFRRGRLGLSGRCRVGRVRCRRSRLVLRGRLVHRVFRCFAVFRIVHIAWGLCRVFRRLAGVFRMRASVRRFLRICRAVRRRQVVLRRCIL